MCSLTNQLDFSISIQSKAEDAAVQAAPLLYYLAVAVILRQQEIRITGQIFVERKKWDFRENQSTQKKLTEYDLICKSYLLPLKSYIA